MPRFTETTFRRLFFATFAVQGIHVFEHIVQLYQVYVLGIPEDIALGLLGYVLQLEGTEEWLHLVFNLAYLAALVLLLVGMRGRVPGSVPRGAFAAFAFAVAWEGWHNVEHAVIISNVIANGGCPCPGIGDVVLGITDTVLHFFYNAIAFAATIPAFWLYTSRSTRTLRAARPARSAPA